jgi:uncharacterized membrane protein
MSGDLEDQDEKASDDSPTYDAGDSQDTTDHPESHVTILSPSSTGSPIFTAFESSTFSGPLPPPTMLAEYERAHPGLAERIVAMAERQVTLVEDQVRNRISMESATVHGDAIRADRGLLFGFLVCLSCFVLAGYMAYLHEAREAIIAVIAPLTGLVGTFVYGTINRSRERANRISKLVQEEERHAKQEIAKAATQKQANDSKAQ